MRDSGKALMTSLDLSRLALKPGEGRRLDVDLVPENLVLAGEPYDFGGEPVPARIEISRTSSGHALRLTLDATLHGPCMRCLGPGTFGIGVESREIDQPGTGDEELASPYVTEDELDLAAWAHDAIALALPQTLLCRPECAGICPVCGISLNDVEPGRACPRERARPALGEATRAFRLALVATILASMAVPKKRTSRTRRDKRRAQHTAATPRTNRCPRCHSPRLPHRVCPTCGTYAGREVIRPDVGDELAETEQ